MADPNDPNDPNEPQEAPEPDSPPQHHPGQVFKAELTGGTQLPVSRSRFGRIERLLAP